MLAFAPSLIAEIDSESLFFACRLRTDRNDRSSQFQWLRMRDQVIAKMKESKSRRLVDGDCCDVPVVDAVRERLAKSGHCGLRSIQVHVDNQSILLSGNVSTYFLKQTAQELARTACPDHELKNSIVVV